MLAKKYKAEIVSLYNPINDIYVLEMKSKGRPFKYHSGQFLHLAIDENYDGICQWPESRCFSMQSNPTEETIRITYAVKGDFTKNMEQTLRLGSEVWLKLPYGDLFDQNHKRENTVFIAGGTGITPFLSLFTNESFKEYINPKIYLGFRTNAYNIYRKELDNLSNLTKLYIQDINGIIDIQHIFNENGTSSNYFISGPPAMIRSFKQALLLNGVPTSNVITDDWE